MKLGEHYHSNLKRISKVTDAEWRAALKKCKDHIILKLKQKTLFGAHTAANLGTDPIDYYIELASEKLLSGMWEWKSEYSLSEQMIRIINSYTSKEVERIKTDKSKSFKIVYVDIEKEFYDSDKIDENDIDQKKVYEERIQQIESAIKGDSELEFFWDAIKEGKKRHEIAELFDINPKQLDKLKERFVRCVRNSLTVGK